MTIPTQLCSKCHEDFMNCKCTQFFPNIEIPTEVTFEPVLRLIKKQYEFTIEELRALYKVVEHQYISYEDQEAHAVINKIMRILKEHE